jgi:hypothetical protein
MAKMARGLGAPEAEFERFAARLVGHLVEHGMTVPA